MSSLLVGEDGDRVGPSRAGRRISLFIFLGYTFLFWILREHSYSGDWWNWVGFLKAGLWYRLREPVVLVFFQLPYLALQPFGVTPKAVFAAVSCVSGGISMVYAFAILRRSCSERGAVVFGMLALTFSYGVTGVFFGHIECYAIMSLGCFAYIHYALRYLDGEHTIVAPSLAFGLLLTTHLMAAWLLPSLLLLPWLRGAPARSRDFARSLVVVAVPNLLVWLVVLFGYYDGAPVNFFNDLATGGYSKQHWGVGNSLGGDGTTFLTLDRIFSLSHARGVGTLLSMYSAFLLPAFVVCASSRPRERFAWLLHSATGRFLLGLWLPYTLFVLTWRADLGYARDWDLFSHWTLFALLPVLGMLSAAKLPGAARAALGLGLLASVLTTSYLVLESHERRTLSGPVRYFGALEIDASSVRPPAQQPRRPVD